MEEFHKVVTRFARVMSVPIVSVQTTFYADHISMSVQKGESHFFLGYNLYPSKRWSTDIVPIGSVENFDTSDEAISNLAELVSASKVLVI